MAKPSRRSIVIYLGVMRRRARRPMTRFCWPAAAKRDGLRGATAVSFDKAERAEAHPRAQSNGRKGLACCWTRSTSQRLPDSSRGWLFAAQSKSPSIRDAIRLSLTRQIAQLLVRQRELQIVAERGARLARRADLNHLAICQTLVPCERVPAPLAAVDAGACRVSGRRTSAAERCRTRPAVR